MHTGTWQVQEAKMKLSDLIRHAKQKPQIITVRGEETAVVLSKKEYDKLTKPKLSIFETMQKFPAGEEVNFERNKDDSTRNIEL